MHQTTEGRLDRGDGTHLAYAHLAGRTPTTVFLPGFRSDMTGAKALAIEAACRTLGTASLRLDYSGHGASDGDFEHGTIGAWTEDALHLIDHLTQGALVLVGSSMGGWIALLAALARPHRTAALIGIAPAPDFTESLLWDALMPPERARLQADGVLYVPSQYGDPTPMTLNLIEEGRTHLLLHAPIPIACPVRLLHGQQDLDVPWETSLRLAERLATPNVQFTFIKDGDHRLSRHQDLACLENIHAALLSNLESHRGES